MGRIRPYEVTDRAAVQLAFWSNVPTHFDSSEKRWLCLCLNDPDSPNFVVEEDDEVVGIGRYETLEFNHRGVFVFGLVQADRNPRLRHFEGQGARAEET